MVYGLEKFKEYFKNFNYNYVLIGGTACEILLNSMGNDFRATKDFNEELSSDKINEMINIKIKEALKNRPRILTFKNQEEMNVKSAEIRENDIIFTLED